MKIQVIGVGGAFSPELGNSSIVIWDDKGRGLLIDCGYAVYPELKKLNIIDKIDSIYITHTHGDHVGSLDTLLYHKRFISKQKVNLYGDILNYLETMDPLFSPDKDGLEYYHSVGPRLEYVEVAHCPELKNNSFINWGIVYSGDTFTNLLKLEFAEDAKVILHEVTFHDVAVHAKFEELCDSPEKIKNKTWLYHYNVGEYETKLELVKQNGFAGLLRQGQIIEVV